MIIGGYSNVAQQVASVYNANNKLLAEILSRIASGKKIQKPTDDLAGYQRYSALEVDIDAYEKVKENLTEAQAGTQLVYDTGARIYELVDEMADLTDAYDQASSSTVEDAIEAEFLGKYAELTDLVNETYWEGVRVHQSVDDVLTVELDPDGSGTLTVTFDATDIITLGNLSDVTDNAAVKGELDEAVNYMYKAKGFNDMLTGAIARTETIISSKEAAQSLIMDIDEAEEMTNQVDMSIRQEAAVAMMAQANLLRSYISRLYYNE